jgi:hypothetical protein
MIEGSGSIPLANGSGSGRPRSGTLIEMVPVQVRKLLISGLQQEYGARLLETLVTSAVLTLPSYTYTDIGRGSLPHLALYIGKFSFSEPLDFFLAQSSLNTLFPDRQPQEGSFNMSENKWDR